MSNIELVQKFISTSSISYCDDCLSEELNIKPRQQINAICRSLAREQFLKREKKPCVGCSKDKLVSIKR